MFVVSLIVAAELPSPSTTYWWWEEATMDWWLQPTSPGWASRRPSWRGGRSWAGPPSLRRSCRATSSPGQTAPLSLVQTPPDTLLSLVDKLIKTILPVPLCHKDIAKGKKCQQGTLGVFVSFLNLGPHERPKMALVGGLGCL